MSNSQTRTASLLSMTTGTSGRAARDRSEGVDRASLWIVLAVGILLMLAAAIGRGEESGAFTASRTDRFSASLGPGATVRVRNVSGEVVASAGKQFSAVVTTTVTARSEARANEILDGTRIVQAREGNEFSLETRWPDASDADSGNRRRRSLWSSHDSHGSNRCSGCRITARYELVIPAGVGTLLHTVNGEVRVRDLDGRLDLASVNGNVVASGTGSSVAAQTVNGRIEVAARAASPGSAFRLNTVNGAVSLILPRDAKFSLSASTMNGSIASTFSLPPREETAEPEEAIVHHDRPPRTPRPTRRAVVGAERDDGGELDLRELEKELDQAMKEVQIEVGDSMREAARQVRRIRILDPRTEYSGSVGPGGASVRISTLNGAVLVLAEGTREADAKPLVSRKRSFAVTIPRIALEIPRIQVNVRTPGARVMPGPVVAPQVHVQMGEDEPEVVRGDVAGDFLSTTGAGGYRIGKVSGRVKILTHSGEIHLASAGAGADVKTFGGDIRIGAVAGDLRAQTMAGAIRCRSVSGSLTAETSGGDIHVDRVDGSAQARTAGGDIVLSSVGGSVAAETGGGEVRVSVMSRDAKGISITDAGGDVTLTLPADFRGDIDLTVLGAPAEDDEMRIHSDFPEVAVTRRSGSQHASGLLNGGGPRVVVRTSSGEIRLRKSPPAGR